MTVIDPQVERLGTLLHLEDKARRAADSAELGFIAVNDTLALVPYRQSALWIGGVRALSGVPLVEAGAPFVLWLNRVADRLAASEIGAGPVDPSQLAPTDAAEWAEWLPPAALWLPLATGGLLVARDTPFAENEVALLTHLAGTYGHAWAALHRPGPWELLRRRLKVLSGRRIKVIATIMVALSLLPVRLSVLAQAEMVPANPVLVRSPLDGVIETIHVRPNDPVDEGQLLFELDATTLSSRLDVAAKALSGTAAEYRQSVQAALWDPKAKAQLAIIGGHIEERQAEVDYLQGQLERTQVKAPKAGIVVFDDPSAWLGRPVSLGEKVMAVTGETDTEVEAWLMVADTIPLDTGAPVTMFLNSAPLSPVHAHMRTIGYEAQPRPEGVLGYRLRASIDDGETRPRVGLRGTARIDGDRVPLIYWLFRKPLAAVRQWLGV